MEETEMFDSRTTCCDMSCRTWYHPTRCLGDSNNQTPAMHSPKNAGTEDVGSSRALTCAC